MGQWQSPTGQLNLNGAQVCEGTELMGSWDSPGLLPWRSGWGVTERVGVCAWDRPRVRADNTWESGGAGKVSRKPEMEAEGGAGKTRAGGLQTIPGTKAVANWGPANHHQARGVPQLGACKPAPGPRGSPSWGPANQLRARGVPQLWTWSPLAASQPRSALWSRLCISGLPSREDESEGLYVAVSMQNQGLHTIA